MARWVPPGPHPHLAGDQGGLENTNPLRPNPDLSYGALNANGAVSGAGHAAFEGGAASSWWSCMSGLTETREAK